MRKLNQKQLEALVRIAQMKDWGVLKKIMQFTVANLANQALGDISSVKTMNQMIIESAYKKGQAYALRMLEKEVDGAYNKLSKLLEEKKEISN